MARVTKTQQAVRRKLVAEGIAASKSIGDLADELGVDRGTVSDDLKNIGSSVDAWAEGGCQAAMVAAISNYEWAMDAARTAFTQDRERLRKWIKGDYDRLEIIPDADGGMREVKKPPLLRLETGAYLSQFISANQKLTKMVGIEGADKHELTGKDGADLFGRMSDADVLRALALDETARLGQSETS